MKIKNLKEYLGSAEFYVYDNDNFLRFLNAIKFKFDIPFIHISGTSGKTCVATLLRNIYNANGYNVGLLTSEDVHEFKDDFSKYPGSAAIFEKYWKEINKFELTIYEVFVFISLEMFKQSNCDICILECFMGGYFDATNIDEAPVLSIMNNAGLEHCDTLGKSASEIALTKGGICKNSGVIVYNSFDPDVEFVMNEIARKTKSKLVRTAEFYDYNIVNYEYLEVGYYPFPKFRINTKALYNRENVACALEAINLLKEAFPVTNENIQKGLLEPIGYGYFDIYEINGKKVICDKANNVYSIEKLCKTYIFEVPEAFEKTAVIFAVDYDKNLEKMLALLSKISPKITLTTYDDENARDESGFFLFLDDYKYNENSLSLLNELLADEEVEYILVTGNEKFIKQFKTN